MKTLRNKIATGFAALTLGAGSLMGCGELFYTHPVDKFIMDNVIPSGLLPQSIKDKQEEEKINEKERRQIEQESEQAAREYSDIPRISLLSNWVYKDKSGEMDKDIKRFSYGEQKTFDLEEEPLCVSIWSGNYEGNVLFRVQNSKDEVIGETKMYITPHSSFGRSTKKIKKEPSYDDFVDKLKESGPGDYLISAELDDGRTLYRALTLIDK